ncbi:MAG: MFS transporter [Pseudobutyrivibrio sp.]|nr:MFS transporter [Pseudobutyrivibrio sp.]
MKLNVKKTIEMGFAFLSICAFWQMYNSIIPLVLTNTFHMNETISGVIMALDNVLALFLLPFFGGLSDRTDTQIGRRKPFILFGTIIAVILTIFIPLIDNSYFANPTLGKEILFVGVLGALLVAMGTYRSPAVALMPDCTPKPLRSRANAIINLMGALGGMLYLVVAALLYPSSKTEGLEHVNYLLLFMVVVGVMLISLIIVMIFVDEVALNKEMLEYEMAHPEDNLIEEDGSGNEVLPKEVKASLIMLLISIAMWFIAYNGMETWFTTYAVKMWKMSLGDASTCLLVATVGAIICYIPSGFLASKIGRKRTILIGVAALIVAFSAGFGFTLVHPSFSPVLYALFALVGIGWAFINVNSLPMVVEMCKGSDIGKFTGLYYTFSMSAQIVTPIVAGWLLSNVSYMTLFPYAAFFAIVAFITMQFVKHGDSEIIIAKKGLDAFEDMD